MRKQPPHIHSLNSSSAKQKYSFGKQKRFSPYKANTDASYLPPIKQDRRSAIIGMGERSPMADKNQGKYPHGYSLPSSISIQKGNSFKAGRYDAGGPLGHIKYAQQIPGPSYQIPSTLDLRGPSIKSRKPDKSVSAKQYIPGPGAYNTPSSIDNGQQSIVQSRFSSGGAMKLSPKYGKSVEIRVPKHEKKQVPGPGQYDTLKYGISNPQNPFSELSKMKIGRQRRSDLVNKQSLKVPGPGQYRIYSQFDD